MTTVPVTPAARAIAGYFAGGRERRRFRACSGVSVTCSDGGPVRVVDEKSDCSITFENTLLAAASGTVLGTGSTLSLDSEADVTGGVLDCDRELSGAREAPDFDDDIFRGGAVIDF